MGTSNFQTAFLHFVDFSQFNNWNVKQYVNTNLLKSNFKIEFLAEHLIEQNNKIKPFDFPEKDFAILGVDNKVGIFDAYISKGKEINQPYKKMETGFIAYNPYRINVGSIGLKTEKHQHQYISPAYVVFSCQATLLPEYLFLVFKTNFYNRIIRENTTGSVRQNLSFDNLIKMQIPLPDINTQKALVQAYQDKMAKADDLEKQANQNFSGCLDEILGIDSKKTEYPKSKLIFVHSKDIDKWGVHQILNPDTDFSNLYPIKTIQELCKVGSGGTPSRSQSEYYQGSIPWVKTREVVNDIILDTEEHISEQAIADTSAKLYPAGSLIIAMYGQGLTRGRTAKLGIDATTNQACAVLSEIKSDEILTDYLWVYLMNEYDRLRALASGNNQPNLNGDMIKNYPVVIPDLEKQAQIASYIQTQKQQQKDSLATASAYRIEALMEFEKAIFK
ncbi:restriction endonuclease subunit S [Neisseria polysaccharea]|uniref:restriction endonuclease subunit S n=1 Tax=Neisseria polysaccharea TaxID=489 RepID=UPI0018C409EB